MRETVGLIMLANIRLQQTVLRAAAEPERWADRRTMGAFRSPSIRNRATAAFCIASAAIWAACRSGQHAEGLAATSPVTHNLRDGATASYGPCKYRENAFRAGVDPPRIVSRVEPDLSGLPALTGANYVFVEVRINEHGRVTEDCMLRGISTDVDTRVLAAVRGWQFDPPRLNFDATVAGKRLSIGTTVPIFMTVSVKVGTSR